MKLCLFDIDGTLIHSAGAGRAALNRAIETSFGIRDALAATRLDGKTDYLIVREALQAAGVENGSKEALDDLFLQYSGFLPSEITARRGEYSVHAGVEDLLERLKQLPDLILGLATGNVETGARAKLEPGNLNRFFALGGFGCDSECRTELIRVAIQRAQSMCPQPLQSVFVIGDTPHDITHGQAAGARVVAVATGFYSVDELRKWNPDYLVSSLAPPEPVMEFIRTH